MDSCAILTLQATSLSLVLHIASFVTVLQLINLRLCQAYPCTPLRAKTDSYSTNWSRWIGLLPIESNYGHPVQTQKPCIK